MVVMLNIDAYAHTLAPNDTYLTVDDVYMNWFKMKFSG